MIHPSGKTQPLSRRQITNKRNLERLDEVMEGVEVMADPPEVNVMLSLKISSPRGASVLRECIRLIEKHHASGGASLMSGEDLIRFSVALPDTSRLGTTGLTNPS